ncbi:MAG TPA: type II toxin-antitoxin system prevent-host-death family antitoxin [Thermoanaerobaculia bacterium]|nr:type II toxin-antitoxin system prevent-host-death family antitoxin [Thermoanaerobaculia bacterium]
MKRVSVSEFKARCLALVAEVRESGEPLLVTKRGKVLVQVTPAMAVERAGFGCMRGTIELDDPEALLQPVLDSSDWESLR